MCTFLGLLTFSSFVLYAWAQFTSQTYPDPRIDPFSCKIPTTGPVCDPSELLTFDEKKALAGRINQLLSYASTVPNTTPACQLFPGKSLEIVIGVIDKIGTVPIAPVDIEKFANNLKSRYQHYQDVSLCDVMVLIVNSKSDRQVFTVAGKDTKLTKEILKTAFEQNINHFRASQFANGLQGMAEFITKAYRDAQQPQPGVPLPAATLLPPGPPKNEVTTAVASGVRQTVDNLSTSIPNTLRGIPPELSALGGGNELGGESSIIPVEDESDQLWIDLLTQAVARCGNNHEKLTRYVQAVVEEAMSFSLRLIADQRYQLIEEDAQSTPGDPDARVRAWNKARTDFIDQIYQKYSITIRSKANLRCPAKPDVARVFSKLRRHLQ